MSDHHHHPPDEVMHFVEKQNITIPDFPATGPILDIGGGGEGIIGILKGTQVITIDPHWGELTESAPGPHKVQMNGQRLGFPRETFGTGTSFCTFGYIGDAFHRAVFREIKRVMQSGGTLHFWDISAPAKFKPDKRYFVLPLRVHVRDQTIDTGYGIRWCDHAIDLAYYRDIAEHVGFETIEQASTGHTLFLKLHKR
ncbi:MAG: class I SAM-dependent methyltransferase [Chloroflexi bacterium]|nr:class I SAM-dependent methyltransferase [Chloroflexota bacterium]